MVPARKREVKREKARVWEGKGRRARVTMMAMKVRRKRARRRVLRFQEDEDCGGFGGEEDGVWESVGWVVVVR